MKCARRQNYFVRAVIGFAALVGASGFSGDKLLAQSAASTGNSKSTFERTAARGWWPTKGDHTRDEYVGSVVCAECHDSNVSDMQGSAMAHAASRASEAESLRKAPLDFQIGAYRYRISDRDGKKVLRISKGAAAESANLLWAFGMGRIAQTYIYEEKGNFYEGHVSFYTGPQALDVTPGHPRTEPPNLEEGLGRLVPVGETRRCFGCHTTASTTKSGFNTRTLFPGVTCEACHGPGAKHVAAMKTGDVDLGLSAIFNPARLNPVDSVDFCGACHRTVQDVLADSPVKIGSLNVRFQPYRLENSRCWKEGKGEGRITCLSCHDPHHALQQDPASYDAKCRQCHDAAGGASAKDAEKGVSEGADSSVHHNVHGREQRSACPVGVKLCVTCHMPRFKNAAMHATFTDHWIRIAAPGAVLPD